MDVYKLLFSFSTYMILEGAYMIKPGSYTISIISLPGKIDF